MIDLSHRLANERIQLLTQRRVHFLVLIPRFASLHRSADWSDRPPTRTPISTAKTPAKRPGFAFSVSTFRGVGEDDATLRDESGKQTKKTIAIGFGADREFQDGLQFVFVQL